MSNANAGYLFYKKYYKDIKPEEWNYISNKGNTEEDNEISNNLKQRFSSINMQIFVTTAPTDISLFTMPTTTHSFSLKTTYPGLLIGSGYTHEVAGNDEELKLGFYFDYTTGMPVIPGSSVKGILRSVFPNSAYNGSKEQTSHEKNFKEKRVAYIQYLLKDIGFTADCNIDYLEYEIFEGFNQSESKYRPIRERDIFFDAHLVPNSSSEIFTEDYITPHKDELKNPIPIKFLKILPGVPFKFQFRLHNCLINAEQKLQLFKRILLDIGVGAKTKVGYGNLVK